MPSSVFEKIKINHLENKLDFDYFVVFETIQKLLIRLVKVNVQKSLQMF